MGSFSQQVRFASFFLFLVHWLLLNVPFLDFSPWSCDVGLFVATRWGVRFLFVSGNPFRRRESAGHAFPPILPFLGIPAIPGGSFYNIVGFFLTAPDAKHTLSSCRITSRFFLLCRGGGQGGGYLFLSL